MELRLPRSNSKLFLVVLVALLLRIAPLILTGMPYDNDSWYIHYDVKVLRSNPEAKILSSPAFDGYDNLWPSSVLTPYLITLIVGKESLLATHIVGPLLDALSIIPFYALASRYSKKYAWLAALVVAASPGLVGIGVGLVKETLARPLFYATILASLRGGLIASLLLGLGLAITHHLSSLTATLTVVLALPTAWLVKTASGSRSDTPRLGESTIILVLTVLWLTYVGLPRLKGTVSLLDPVLASLYILALTSLIAAALPLIREKPGPLAAWLPEIIVLALVAIAAVTGVPPGVQPLGISALYYSAPFLLLPYLAVYALARIRNEPSRRHPIIPLTWLLVVSGAIAYLVFGGVPLGQSPAGRLANYLVPGAAILYAYSGRPRLLKAKALVILVLSILYVGALASNADPESYDLAYHRYEYSTCKLLSSHLQANATVYADAKMRDLLYYLGLVKTKMPLPEPGHGLLVLYKENLVYGYKLDSNLRGGSPEKIARLITGESLVANNGGSWIVLIR